MVATDEAQGNGKTLFQAEGEEAEECILLLLLSPLLLLLPLPQKKTQLKSVMIEESLGCVKQRRSRRREMMPKGKKREEHL